MSAIQTPPNKEQWRQDNTPAPLIVPTLQRENDVLTLQRHRKWYRPPRRMAFFSLPAQRKEPKERAALPLRRPRSTSCGTGGAKTRCAQTVCPLFPVPHPAARLSAKGLFSSPETRHASHRPLGGASVPLGSGGFLRAIVDCSHAGAWEQSFSLPSDFDRGQGPLLVRLRGAESEGCKSPPGRRLLPET